MRKEYESPAIHVLGSVRELTQGNLFGGALDGIGGHIAKIIEDALDSGSS